MAQQFASYGGIERTESWDEEGVGSSQTQTTSTGRRYVSVLAVVLALVGTSLLVTSSYSRNIVQAPSVQGTAFDAAPKVTDLHSSSKKSSKKSSKVDTINFEETFNPTPSKLHPTQKPNHERKLKKSADTINFEETFNPTPVKLHPTQKPNHERKLKSEAR